jgi:response regulator RpfG family c-di-GMP phosphodiesterase
MAKQKIVTDVPEHLNEEFYQINPDILESFSKYRPPLNIYRFNEDVERIIPYYTVGQRLSNEQVEELSEMTVEGFIFVARTDHPIYVKHISHQLDLVLVDKNLKSKEINDIFVQAITRRLGEFFEQPVKAIYERLEEDLMVLTEYLWEDVWRIKGLVKRMHQDHSLPNHSFNSGVMGLNLYVNEHADAIRNEVIKRRDFDRTTIGLFIHDLGMSKIPGFIRGKPKELSLEEKSKVEAHPKVGNEMLAKLDIKFPEIEACVLYHHERQNGSGYPRKIAEKDIPGLGKLCAVVDSFCAAVTDRPYAKAKDHHEAAREIAANEKHYDPKYSRLLQSVVFTT